METELPVNEARVRGWVFYDAECPLCARSKERWGGLFGRRGFVWLPLQTRGAAARLGVSESRVDEEMRLLLNGGRVVGGFDAWLVLFRSVWWLWLAGVVLGLPGIRRLGQAGYGWLARNRHRLEGKWV